MRTHPGYPCVHSRKGKRIIGLRTASGASCDFPHAPDPFSVRRELLAGQFYGTQGWKLQTGVWYHVAGVKQADQLSLYVDGVARATAAVPSVVASTAEHFALGGNPNYVGGPEFLAARLTDLRFYVRALTADEIQTLFQTGAGTTNR